MPDMVLQHYALRERVFSELATDLDCLRWIIIMLESIDDKLTEYEDEDG